ncbi:MAG: hypothetical protein ABL999_19775 [Pyrinomonadaceae bacterium]
MTANKLSRSVAFFAQIGIAVLAFSFAALAQGKNPVILVPGLSGSELRHKVTNERIWFRTFKSKSEDLRLPINPDLSKNYDDLVPGDVLRGVKLGVFPVTDVYGGFIKAMEVRGGYHEEKWDSPSENGFEDSLYVFAYDWRLDCVENARLLVKKVEALKVTLKKPDLKFDIVAHSMGGLISRYAAMYGDADLGTGKAVPTWAGSKLFDKIVLLGTPNEGSALSLSGLINGFTLGGMRIDLPFVQDTSKFTIFSVPSAYELLPSPGTFRAFDEKLQPLELDLYDPKIWAKYGWNAVDDKEFAVEFKAVKKEDAESFFAASLDHAKRFHQALDAANGKSEGVAFYAIGSDCRSSLDAVVIYQDLRTKKWTTLFQPKEFTASDGKKVSADDLKKIMFTPGDGVVTQRSLSAVTVSEKAKISSIFNGRSNSFICGEHNKLAANSKIQEYIIGLLSKPTESMITGN